MKTSRAFLSEVQNTFGAMPFTLRALEDEKRAKLGVVECAKHNLITPFHVLYEKEGHSSPDHAFLLAETALLRRRA